MELCVQIAVLLAGSRPGALDQGRLQPGRAFAHTSGAWSDACALSAALRASNRSAQHVARRVSTPPASAVGTRCWRRRSARVATGVLSLRLISARLRYSNPTK